MASLSEIQEATLTANTSVESKTSTVATALDSLDVAGAGAGSRAANGGFLSRGVDFVGINTNAEEEILQAIDAYCANINSTIDELQATASPEGTFSGEYATGINEFILSIKNSCKSTVDSLKTFKVDMQSAIASMRAKDTSVSGNLSDDSASINSAASGNESN